ncbi:MAG: ATP-binding cassette domain-containing protein [Methanobacteriaceae archaeon]|nr:ATP-binding cassette domain-containing protein [Methanobacteriaceae archaeon]
MALVEFNNFNFGYEDKEILSNINFQVENGEFVLLCGPSGSGKTTLLSCIKKELKPKGNIKGTVKFDGKEIDDIEDYKSACDIGFLFQNPDNQIVTDTVIQEISFPLENIGLPPEEIRNRVAEMAAFFGLDKILNKDVNQLSGGQKQLVNLCSLLVLKPKLLLLDEPTSQLDPIASYDFLTILRRLNEEFSITIMITEHKHDNIFPFIDRALFLENGKIKYSNDSREICKDVKEDPIFNKYMPSPAKTYFTLTKTHPEINKKNVPLSIREGRRIINNIDNLKKVETPLPDPTIEFGDTLIECKGMWFGYTKDKVILKDIYLDIKKGEYISVIGGNGTGKSTLLQLVAKLIKPVKGKVSYKKGTTIGYVHQNPMIHFTQDSVKNELCGEELSNLNVNISAKDIIRNKSSNDLDEEVTLSDEALDYLEFFGISHLIDHHPYDCSGGEQQKIAIIKVLLQNPDVLILDEPTKGLDPVSNINLSNKLKKLVEEEDITILMTTHDLDFVANNCHRCIMVFDGNLQLDNTPRSIFSNNSFYTTFINRLIKDQIPSGITLTDVKNIWT